MFSEENNLLFTLPFNHLDQSSFNLVLYELANGPLNFDVNRLESLMFNPLDQPRLPDIFSNYLDPDVNLTYRPPTSRWKKCLMIE